ncbi:MAG: T9SS type A sorting domain-containing protein [Bacteroidetes bacterium]|nr:T9SS type A sorting domain-containing protein [Bacteroidota bacterium]
MMKILTIRIYIIFSFFIIVSLSSFSQGLVENDLSTNQVLVKKWNDLKMSLDLRASSIYDTIDLDTVKGFLDDFSYNSPYPDSALWLDNQVFVNRGYAKSPISVGAATFDGLNEKGYPYDFFVSSTSSSSADSLTSKPINLLNYINNGSPVNYLVSDSLYFSFFYQPQGLGNAPDLDDSLVLEFIAPGISSWKHIWAKKGSSLGATDSSWNLVMVPIKDIQYFKKGFQFRFRNYATVSGNLDHWNIDYVYLNKFRTKADTIFEDVAFVYNTPSLLNTYSEMPWKHYTPSFMKTSLPDLLRNNNSLQKNVNFYYKVYDQLGTAISSSVVSSDNVLPFSQIGYYNYTATSLPVFPVLTDTSSYTFECVLSTNPDKHKKNDTVRHTQKFLNSYAYDDGSAETAFGLSTLNAQMAEKFTSTIADTLRCIDIYFNPLLTNANLYAFSLNVWNDNGGSPGTAIYTSDTVHRPMYAQAGQDQFTHYYLYPPLYLNASTFYIGFTQKTTQFLNVGVDKNTNTQDKMFYNVTGAWNNSPFTGSLMMHPVFGIADYYAGIDSPDSKNKNAISVYPNPANDKLYINLNSDNGSEKISYSIIDLYGRAVLENKFDRAEYIDISSLAEGVYFIRIVDGIQVSTNKFIKIN